MRNLRNFSQKLYLISLLALIGLAWGTPTEASNLRLTWTDNSSNEDGFKIQRLNGSSYVDIATVSANNQSYTDSGLTPGQTYCYQVRAFNSAGVSEPSNEACANAPDSGTGQVPPGGGGGGGGSGGGGGVASTSRWSDYRFSLNIQSTSSGEIGVMFRYQDSNNYYRFVWNKKARYRRVEKLQDGIVKVLAQDTARYQTGHSYRLVIEAQGSTLSIWIDGASIFSVNDTSFTDGTVGLYSYYNRGSMFDDILVEDLTTGTVWLSDDFSDGDFQGWTILDQGSRFGPSLWSAQNGALVQSSNIGSETAQKLGTFALFTKRSWTNYRATARLQSQDQNCLGVMFRYQDDANYYRFSWCKDGSVRRRLDKFERDIMTTLAEDALPYEIGRAYQLGIVADGAKLEVQIDGSAIFSVIDSSFSEGTIALYSWKNQGSVFDDVLVEDLLNGIVLLWDDFNDRDFKGWTILDEVTTGAPCVWSAQDGALVQRSNIGATDTRGTFALY